jgi:hypothetical protein
MLSWHVQKEATDHVHFTKMLHRFCCKFLLKFTFTKGAVLELITTVQD